MAAEQKARRLGRRRAKLLFQRGTPRSVHLVCCIRRARPAVGELTSAAAPRSQPTQDGAPMSLSDLASLGSRAADLPWNCPHPLLMTGS